MLRALTVAVAVAVFALSAVSPLRAEEQSYSGLSFEQEEKVFQDLRDEWFPTAIKGYADGNHSRYDMTWKKGVIEGWYLYVGMTAETFAKRKEELKQKGYALSVESHWEVNGEMRYAGIWQLK